MLKLFKKEEKKEEFDANLFRKQVLTGADGLKIPMPSEADIEKSRQRNYFIVTYSLKNKNPKEKVVFVHKFEGRGNKKGILEEIGGEKITRGAFLAPEMRIDQVSKFLIRNGIEFKKKKILLLED